MFLHLRTQIAIISYIFAKFILTHYFLQIYRMTL